MFPSRISRPLSLRRNLANIILAIDYLECAQVDARFAQFSLSATIAELFPAVAKPIDPAVGGYSSPAFPIISSALSIGFSGGRRVSETGPLSKIVRACCRRVSPLASIFTGCASGVDTIVRSEIPGIQVIRMEDFYRGGNVRSAYAMRSIELVRRVGPGGLWVAFPDGSCPEGLRLCKLWESAHGSGTWGSLALAGGSGLRCLCYAQSCAEKPPASWGFKCIGEGWFYRGLPGEAKQLSLF